MLSLTLIDSRYLLRVLYAVSSRVLLLQNIFAFL